METTSTTSVQDAVQHLITQIQTGNAPAAFEELYDDDVVMIQQSFRENPQLHV